MTRSDLEVDDRSAVKRGHAAPQEARRHTEKSLAAIPAGPSTRRSLRRIADPEVHASLAVLGPETDREGVLARIAEQTGR